MMPRSGQPWAYASKFIGTGTLRLAQLFDHNRRFHVRGGDGVCRHPARRSRAVLVEQARQRQGDQRTRTQPDHGRVQQGGRELQTRPDPGATIRNESNRDTWSPGPGATAPVIVSNRQQAWAA